MLGVIDNHEVIEMLRTRCGFDQAYHVTTFEAYGQELDGAGEHKVIVTIADAGPDYPPRYRVRAVDEFGRTASGNAHNSLQAAIALVHWSNLDGPRVRSDLQAEKEDRDYRMV